MTAAPIAPAGSAARGAVIVVRDLTAQRDAEHSSVELGSSLASTNALLDTLFERAPIGMGFWDRELRYVRVNAALARINGLPVEAHLGRTISEVLPKLEPRVEAAFRTVLETGQPLSELELQGETPAAPGVLRTWRTSVYPVTVANALVGVGAVCDEITELKRVEAQRLELLEAESHARARAEEMSRLKDDFISTLSHELRNPLNSIVGWTHLLESGKLSEADREKAIERITRNVKTQAKLVEELLDFSRLSTGKLQLKLERLECLGAGADRVRDVSRGRQSEEHRSRLPHRSARFDRAGRCRAPAPDPLQPALECREVHARGRFGRGPCAAQRSDHRVRSP